MTGNRNAHKFFQAFHDPFTPTPLGWISDDRDQGQFGAYAQHGSLLHYASCILLLSLLRNKSRHGPAWRSTKGGGKGRYKCGSKRVGKSAVKSRYDLWSKGPRHQPKLTRRNQSAHLYCTPDIFLSLAPPNAFNSCASDLVNILLQAQWVNVFEDMFPILSTYWLAHTFDQSGMSLQRRIQSWWFWDLSALVDPPQTAKHAYLYFEDSRWVPSASFVEYNESSPHLTLRPTGCHWRLFPLIQYIWLLLSDRHQRQYTENMKSREAKEGAGTPAAVSSAMVPISNSGTSVILPCHPCHGPCRYVW